MGEIKEHDPYGAACFVQMSVGLSKQVYDGVFTYNHKTISKLQWVLDGACLLVQVGQ